MKVKGTWNLARLKKKWAKWEQQLGREVADSVIVYGREATKIIVDTTPPADGHTPPGEAINKLKERVSGDFMGDGLKPFSDEDIRWVRQGGKLYSFIAGTHSGRPSPFRVIRGRANKTALDALRIGRHHVEFVTGSLSKFIRAHRDQYYMSDRTGTFHFRFVGARHVTTEARVLAEMRRRQNRAGRLMSGWKQMAHATKTRLPYAAEKLNGRGTVAVKKNGKVKAMITGKNKVFFPGMQKIIDRQVPAITRKNKSIARRRIRKLARQMNTP